MTPTKQRMKYLETRNYDDLDVPDHLIHFVKMRDRLAYYSLQLKPFFNQEPWDLPVRVNGRLYPPTALETLQGHNMSAIDFYGLLTDIEVALIEAAARRGITLRKRGTIDEDTGSDASPQRRKRMNCRSLADQHHKL
ncbi:hypothetical protein LCM28_13380 [Salipiger pacificus]|nr:hypothetical protein [Alloyangia pacifica]